MLPSASLEKIMRGQKKRAPAFKSKPTAPPVEDTVVVTVPCFGSAGHCITLADSAPGRPRDPSVAALEALARDASRCLACGH